jgi:hypothetical protein
MYGVKQGFSSSMADLPEMSIGNGTAAGFPAVISSRPF